MTDPQYRSTRLGAIVRQTTAAPANDPFAANVQRFRTEVEGLVGREISVSLCTTTTRPKGDLMRVSDEGLVVAGYGIVVYSEIGQIECDGITVAFAK